MKQAMRFSRNGLAMTMTPKRETFCWHVATGLCPTDAYRESAFASDNMKDATIHNSAYKLMQTDEVRARIAEIRKEIQAESGITTKTVTDMLLSDRQIAHESKQAGAAVSATMGVAKVNGLLDRLEASTAVNLTIEQAAPRDIAKAILRVMAQAATDRDNAECACVLDHPPDA